MKNKTVILILFAIFLTVNNIFAQQAAHKTAKNKTKTAPAPAYYEHLPEWYKAVAIKKRVQTTAYITEDAKASLLAMFRGLQDDHDFFFDGTNPILQELNKYRNQLKDHNADVQKQREQAASLQQKIDATPASGRTEAWASQINKQARPLNGWEKKIAERKSRLDEWMANLDLRIEQMYRDWENNRDGFKEWLASLKQFSEVAAGLETEFRTSPKNAEARQKLQVDFAGKLKSTQNRDVPIEAPLINHEESRSAYEYMKVIDQFRVQEKESLRYAKDGVTHCNTFARDVAGAMGVKLPSGADTNAMVEWLPSEAGKSEGWDMAKTDTGLDTANARARVAQAMANKGWLVIAIFPGHVAVVRPGSPGERNGPAVAQAGALVFKASHLNNKKILKVKDFDKIQFWYHK
jgi:hypothetical protein